VASVALDPKLKVTLLPAFLVSKSLPILLNASVKEAAARTVILPPAEDLSVLAPEPAG
jgi:hypothetical protein